MVVSRSEKLALLWPILTSGHGAGTLIPVLSTGASMFISSDILPLKRKHD